GSRARSPPERRRASGPGLAGRAATVPVVAHWLAEPALSSAAHQGSERVAFDVHELAVVTGLEVDILELEQLFVHGNIESVRLGHAGNRSVRAVLEARFHLGLRREPDLTAEDRVDRGDVDSARGRYHDDHVAVRVLHDDGLRDVVS